MFSQRARAEPALAARRHSDVARLHVAQMMGIGWLAATDEARLLHDTAKVLPVG